MVRGMGSQATIHIVAVIVTKKDTIFDRGRRCAVNIQTPRGIASDTLGMNAQIRKSGFKTPSNAR